MLSILIPTFNYNALPLAKILESQALKLGIVFELICMDDGSFSNKNDIFSVDCFEVYLELSIERNNKPLTKYLKYNIHVGN